MMLQGGPVAMSLQSTLIMLGAAILGASGYYCIVQAMRIGEISVVAPFRYSRIFLWYALF